MVQVTPTLAQRPRVRGGSGDTWRYRSLHCRKDPGRLERDPGSPDLRGESALRVGRCWSGEGLEIGRRGGRWTVCKPRPAGWGGSSCAGGREGADSWAVVEGQHGGGDWFVETPPRSTLRGERVPQRTEPEHARQIVTVTEALVYTRQSTLKIDSHDRYKVELISRE